LLSITGVSELWVKLIMPSPVSRLNIVIV
jgi:hypothetical protein